MASKQTHHRINCRPVQTRWSAGRLWRAEEQQWYLLRSPNIIAYTNPLSQYLTVMIMSEHEPTEVEVNTRYACLGNAPALTRNHLLGPSTEKRHFGCYWNSGCLGSPYSRQRSLFFPPFPLIMRSWIECHRSAWERGWALYCTPSRRPFCLCTV